MIGREAGYQEAGPFHESDLKICDLCGALNLAVNNECFVCGWHGRFEKRPEYVRIAMETLRLRHGRLELHWLTNIHTYRQTVAPSPLARLRRLFLRIHHWLFG